MIYNKWIIYQNKLCYNWRHNLRLHAALRNLHLHGRPFSHCLSFDSTPIGPKVQIQFCSHWIWNALHCLQVWQYWSHLVICICLLKIPMDVLTVKVAGGVIIVASSLNQLLVWHGHCCAGWLVTLYHFWFECFGDDQMLESSKCFLPIFWPYEVEDVL